MKIRQFWSEPYFIQCLSTGVGVEFAYQTPNQSLGCSSNTCGNCLFLRNQHLSFGYITDSLYSFCIQLCCFIDTHLKLLWLKASKENKFQFLRHVSLILSMLNSFTMLLRLTITHFTPYTMEVLWVVQSCGVRTFSSHAPCLQKSSPSNIRNSTSLPVPRLDLKMFVLNLAFHYWSSRFLYTCKSCIRRSQQTALYFEKI